MSAFSCVSHFNDEFKWNSRRSILKSSNHESISRWLKYIVTNQHLMRRKRRQRHPGFSCDKTGSYCRLVNAASRSGDASVMALLFLHFPIEKKQTTHFKSHNMNPLMGLNEKLAQLAVNKSVWTAFDRQNAHNIHI